MRPSVRYVLLLWLLSLLVLAGYVVLYTKRWHRPAFKRGDTLVKWKDEILPSSNDIESVEESTIIWAVLVGKKSWALNLLLDSLRGMGIILVAKGQKSKSIDAILKKHHINFMSAPNDCYISTAGRESCVKNNWLWLMKNAWSLEPKVVCYTTEDFILHPDARSFVTNYSANEQNGIKLSSGTSAFPWCFGRKVWSRIAKSWDSFCSLEQHSLADAIGLVLNVSKSQTAGVLSTDLALDLGGCGIGDEVSNECSERVASFYAESRDHIEYRKQEWAMRNRSLFVERNDLKQHAQCRGRICEGFQFQQTTDDRVYFNRPMDGKGQNAYIIDLGPTCINTSKVRVARGGERVEEVMGRNEKEEFPVYEQGAFQIYKKIPKVNTNFYQSEILRSAVLMDKLPTVFDFPGSTIAYTRFDYANVCFTVNDLFNLYLTLEHAQSNRMVWLDGHASGNFDHVTSDLFDMNVLRIGQMSEVKCFERLILQPKKYVLYYVKKFDSCDVNDFVEMMWKKFNITSAVKKHDTVIIRDYYLAHPRVTKEVTRKFSDAELDNIGRKLPEARFIKFHELSWEEQLQIIANTKTLYGMHGAGLTLGLFLGRGSSMVEWMHRSRATTLTFSNLMTWRPGVKFRRCYLNEWLND